MIEVKDKPRPFWMTASRMMDGLVGVISPKAAMRRKQYRMAYEILDGSAQRKRRPKYHGTGDTVLTEERQDTLREINRDLCRNSSIVKGMLATEANDVVGENGPMVQARTDDKAWNKAAEAFWKSSMVDDACDITGTMNWPAYLWLEYYSYRRDGDMFTLYSDAGLQGIEGECCGTPVGKKTTHLKIVNGVAYDDSGRVLGYYIGKPDKWGYIKTSDWKAYAAKDIRHVMRRDRFSASRGEPALTSALKYLDMLDGYLDAELVAAKVAACFSVFISQKGYAEDGIGPTFGGPGGATGTPGSESGMRQEKLSPGQIVYGDPDESANVIANPRPGSQFDMFIRTLQSISGRAICMPLMYVTMDFSGATFMNTRVALQTAQKLWRTEQTQVIVPSVHRAWRWRIQWGIDHGYLTDHPQKNQIEVFCHRWPYVDPYREAQAEKIQLENRTTNRHILCGSRGDDYEEIELKRQTETEPPAPAPAPAAPAKKEDDDD